MPEKCQLASRLLQAFAELYSEPNVESRCAPSLRALTPSGLAYIGDLYCLKNSNVLQPKSIELPI